MGGLRTISEDRAIRGSDKRLSQLLKSCSERKLILWRMLDDRLINFCIRLDLRNLRQRDFPTFEFEGILYHGGVLGLTLNVVDFGSMESVLDFFFSYVDRFRSCDNVITCWLG